MGDLTLPGDIPGLLRRCSPVVVSFRRDPTRLRGVWDGGRVLTKDGLTYSLDMDAPDDDIRADLDLAGATGRTHAAWWALERWPGNAADGPESLPGFDFDVIYLVFAARDGGDLNDEAVDTLRRVVLHLAGRPA